MTPTTPLEIAVWLLREPPAKLMVKIEGADCRRLAGRATERDLAVIAIGEWAIERKAKNAERHRPKRRDILHRATSLCLSWQPVVAAIVRRHWLTMADVTQDCRVPKIVACRQEIWWAIRKKFGASTPDIGRRFGGYDHTTVMHGIAQHQARLDAAQARVASRMRLAA